MSKEKLNLTIDPDVYESAILKSSDLGVSRAKLVNAFLEILCEMPSNPKTQAARGVVEAELRRLLGEACEESGRCSLHLKIELPLFITGDGNGIAIGNGNRIQTHPKTGGAK